MGTTVEFVKGSNGAFNVGGGVMIDNLGRVIFRRRPDGHGRDCYGWLADDARQQSPCSTAFPAPSTCWSVPAMPPQWSCRTC